jgi:hypothetical protein
MCIAATHRRLKLARDLPIWARTGFQVLHCAR